MSYNGPPGQGPPQHQQQPPQPPQQQHGQPQQQHPQQPPQHPLQHHHPHPQYMYYQGQHPQQGHPGHPPQQQQQQQGHPQQQQQQQGHPHPQQQGHPLQHPQQHPQQHPPQHPAQQHPPPPQQHAPAPPPSNAAIPPLAQAHVCICPNVTRVPRPRNAFILYRQHHHSIVVAENPGKSNPEISKIIGEQWRSLAQAEKDFWVQLSDEEKRSHLERFPDYRYQPRRNPKKNGGENNSGVCPVCRGITSAGAGGNTYSPRHSSGGSSGSGGSGSFSSVSGNSGSISSISSMSSHSSFDAASGMPYPPPPPPPQAALFHPHYPHPAARYSYPTSVEHVAAQTRHNSAPETFSALPRIVPRDELEQERERAASSSSSSNAPAPTPPTKHIKFESTTPKLSSQPLQYSPAFHSPLSLNSLTHRTRLPPTHALIEEDHATKRRRTSSYHDPLAPHHLPQQQRRSVRYKSAIAIASGRISPLVGEEGGAMSMREKADALSMLCEPLPGNSSERSRIVAIEGGGEWGKRVVELVREKLAKSVGVDAPASASVSEASTAQTQTASTSTPAATPGASAAASPVASASSAASATSGASTEAITAANTAANAEPPKHNYSFVTLHNIAGASHATTTSSTPQNSLACIINQKPDFITDGFASAMWNITCLHQLVSNYFRTGASSNGIVLLHGYLVTIADKFVQEHLMRQSHASTYSEEVESEAMERWKRDTSVIPEESESGSPASGGAGRSPSVAIAPHSADDESREAREDKEHVTHVPHSAHPHHHVAHPHPHETRVAELAHESRGSVSHPRGSVSEPRGSVSESRDSVSSTRDLPHSSYLEEWMSSANLLRGLPSPDVLIYLQAEGSELESSAVELRGQGKLVVVRGDDSIMDKVVDKIIQIVEAL